MVYMVSQAESISKGYHSLVPGLISIFLETVWVPLNSVIAMSRLDGVSKKYTCQFLVLFCILLLQFQVDFGREVKHLQRRDMQISIPQFFYYIFFPLVHNIHL